MIEGNEPDQVADDPYEKYSVITMSTVDQTVERIRLRNIRLHAGPFPPHVYDGGKLRPARRPRCGRDFPRSYKPTIDYSNIKS
jgi:hypothetical protein